MTEIKTESQGSPSGMPAESVIVEYLPDIGEILESILPVDVEPLQKALKAFEGKLEAAMKGSAVEFIAATKARDEAKQTLHNATALTQDESLAISLNAHKSLLALHEIVSDFDALHGISYATKKGRDSAKTRISGRGEILPSDYAKIPEADKLTFRMSYSDGVITLFGKNTGNEHTCRTMSTLVRHQEN